MSRNFSIGELTNIAQGVNDARKAFVADIAKKISTEVKNSFSIGTRIIWYGFCSSLVVYMLVKAFMLAV
jgi:hypothetical protein